MASRKWEFLLAQELLKPQEIPVTREFLRFKLFPPISWEMKISQEFPARGFPLNIPVLPSLLGRTKVVPTAQFDTPTQTLCSFFSSKIYRIRALVKAFFKASKAPSSVAFHLNSIAFRVRFVRGFAMVAKLLTNLLQKLTSPKNPCTMRTQTGVGLHNL